MTAEPEPVDATKYAVESPETTDPTGAPTTAAATDEVGCEVISSANDSGAATTPTSSPSSDTTTESRKGTLARIRKWGLPSLPILKILQGIFLILMIGQNVPGPHKTFWPFNSSNEVAPDTNKPLSPYYVEMRSDLYGHERQFSANDDNEDSGLMMRLLLGSKSKPPLELPQNTGIPDQQNIVLTLLNREYESYRYSMQASTTSKVQAAIEFGKVSFYRALEKVLLRLSDRRDRLRLTILEERFLEEAGGLVDTIVNLRSSLVDTNSTFGLEQCNTNTTSDLLIGQLPFHEVQGDVNGTFPMSPQLCLSDHDTESELPSADQIGEEFSVANTTLSMIEITSNMLSARVQSFLKEITDSLPSGPGNAIKDTLVGHSLICGLSCLVNDLRKSPMRLHFSARKKRLFVTRFLGDIFATAVANLRKEVTAIVRSAESGDEVLVILQSGGGTVTGYGLVAAQLMRIKDAGLRLTVAVEQVAASGGYMVACVGDTIVCSPFAVVGSIGVVQEMPNFYERLKREGVEFHEITAGDYKRVLSPTKEATPKDLKKAKEDLEDVWQLFKDFVAEQRPSLKIDVVATGEVWFGKRAVEVGLCDAIQASDDILTDFVDRGYDVYNVKYEEHVEELFEKFFKFGKGDASGLVPGRFLQKAVSLLVNVWTASKNEETLESWNTIKMV